MAGSVIARHLGDPLLFRAVGSAPGQPAVQGSQLAGTRFYFVHSYAAQKWEGDTDALLTWATHHVRFLAAVEDGPRCRRRNFIRRRAVTPVRRCS